MRTYKLEDKVITWYGEEDYTFKEAIERGDMKVVCKNDLETNWKNEYRCVKGLVHYKMDGRQIKKYMKNIRKDY